MSATNSPRRSVSPAKAVSPAGRASPDRRSVSPAQRPASPAKRSVSPVARRSVSPVARRDENQGSNLYVTSLAHSVTDDVLREAFQVHGEIERAEIVRDPHTRDSRGFAFVNYSSGDAAQAALKALDGVEIEGRAIIAKRQRARTPTPGRYRGPERRDSDRYSRDRGYDRDRRDRSRDRGYDRDRGYERREDRRDDRRDDRGYNRDRGYDRDDRSSRY